jgi:hypothetical protein
MVPFVALLAGLLLVPSPAHAYIDPGILGILYQAAYALIFGTFVALVLRPWQYLKGLYGKLTGRTRHEESEAHVHGAGKGERDTR